MPDKQLSDVIAFQKKFGHDYDGPPTLRDPEMRRFRLLFFLEELAELAECLGFTLEAKLQYVDGLTDPVGTLDALVDLDYVLKGTVRQLGLAGVYGRAWDRVHAANMKKIAGRKPDRAFSLEGSDVTKPDGWVAPDLTDLIYKDAAE